MQMSAIESVEAEIRRERAESLGRAGDRLEQVLAEIRAHRGRLFLLAERWLAGQSGAHMTPAEIQTGLAKDAKLCERAREVRYQLVVQREAVGLLRHHEVDRHYSMPAALTLAGLLRRGTPR